MKRILKRPLLQAFLFMAVGIFGFLVIYEWICCPRFRWGFNTGITLLYAALGTLLCWSLQQWGKRKDIHH